VAGPGPAPLAATVSVSGCLGGRVPPRPARNSNRALITGARVALIEPSRGVRVSRLLCRCGSSLTIRVPRRRFRIVQAVTVAIVCVTPTYLVPGVMIPAMGGHGMRLER